MDPVVARALYSLTAFVNLRRPLLDDDDTAATVSLFRCLAKAGYPWRVTARPGRDDRPS